jgi:molybdate transport system substrate-binding protein
MRAKEALVKTGLWESLKSKLVFGENISQATQFALSGSAQGGIIAQSLALSPSIERLGHFELIPESWHQPLMQRMALMKDAPKVIEDFYRYISGRKAQSIMRRFGFSAPQQQRS